MWLIFAIGSAVFAGITSILAKCGIRHTDSTVATALRTVVVLLFSWILAVLQGISGSVRGWTHLVFPGSFGTGNRRFLALLFPGVAGWRCKQSCGH